MSKPPRADTAQDLKILGRGFCMGCADVVPGVSGGTVALILGIYERLVTAISRFDATAVGQARSRQWRALAAHVDLRFLVALGLGIGVGVVGMSLIVNRLMGQADTRALTFAGFFGMILASAIVVARLIRPQSRHKQVQAVMLGVLGAVVAYWVSTLDPAGHAAEDPGALYLFLCGSIAICAMILPGISGAMILLVLGVYEHLTDVPRNLLKGEAVGESLLTLVVFGLGCAISLLLFSKVLRWLLANFHTPTMSLLCGFMFGALRKLWPFQEDLTPDVVKFKHKTFQPELPDTFDSQVAGVLLVAVAAMALVFTADYLVRRQK